jgi:hypothetical protein
MFGACDLRKKRQRIPDRLEDDFCGWNLNKRPSAQRDAAVRHFVPRAMRLIEVWRKRQFKKEVGQP